MAFDYTIAINMDGRKALVVGAGAIGSRKVKSLLASGARVKLVSAKISAAMAATVRKNGGTVRRGKYRASDLGRPSLVFAATDDTALNVRICAAADKKGILASSASRAADGAFSVPGVAKSGPIHITVSTGGASPAMAKAIRIHLKQALNKSGLPALARTLGRKRRS
jgi:siroheme synthase-like protein